MLLKFLGTESPMRTSLGLILGVFLHGVFRFFEDLLQLSVSVSFDSANHLFFPGSRNANNVLVSCPRLYKP